MAKNEDKTEENLDRRSFVKDLTKKVGIVVLGVISATAAIEYYDRREKTPVGNNPDFGPQGDYTGV